MKGDENNDNIKYQQRNCKGRCGQAVQGSRAATEASQPQEDSHSDHERKGAIVESWLPLHAKKTAVGLWPRKE